jgi:hypothetical protein
MNLFNGRHLGKVITHIMHCALLDFRCVRWGYHCFRNKELADMST